MSSTHLYASDLFNKYRIVGVYDTVGSVLGMVDALSIQDNHLPVCVDFAIQALAIH